MHKQSFNKIILRLSKFIRLIKIVLGILRIFVKSLFKLFSYLVVMQLSSARLRFSSS